MALSFSIESLLKPEKPIEASVEWQLLGIWANNLLKNVQVSLSPNPPNEDAKSKLFECKDCGKAFSAHYNLARHLPIHTGELGSCGSLKLVDFVVGERPFVCKVCGKAFRQASTLCRHKVCF